MEVTPKELLMILTALACLSVLVMPSLNTWCWVHFLFFYFRWHEWPLCHFTWKQMFTDRWGCLPPNCAVLLFNISSSQDTTVKICLKSKWKETQSYNLDSGIFQSESGSGNNIVWDFYLGNNAKCHHCWLKCAHVTHTKHPKNGMLMMLFCGMWNIPFSLCVTIFQSAHLLFSVTHMIHLLKWKCQCFIIQVFIWSKPVNRNLF